MVSKRKKQSEFTPVIWGMIILVLVFFVSFYGFAKLEKIRTTVEYQNLTFKKELIGPGLMVYHYYYLYEDKTGQLIQNNIYLRNNPKENNISVEGSKITYLPRKFTYVSINTTALEGCNQSAIAISELSSFLANGGLQVRGAIMNNATEFFNVTKYVTCQSDPGSPVIQINSGNETKITVDSLCYNIQFTSCLDVLPAVEKFIVTSIIDAKKSNSKYA